MTYEYESKLKNRLLDLEFDTWEETAQFEREYRELECVYRKAKAFDKISNLIEENYVDYGENNLEDIEAIVNEYWEDKQNGL